MPNLQGYEYKQFSMLEGLPEMYKTAAFALFVGLVPTSALSASSEALLVTISSGWQSLQQDVSVDLLEEQEATLERVNSAVETLLSEYPQHDLSVRLKLGETVGTLSLDALAEQSGRLVAEAQQEVWNKCRELPNSACLLESLTLLTAVWENGPQPEGQEQQTKHRHKVFDRLVERGDATLIRLLASHLRHDSDLAQRASLKADLLDDELDVAVDRVRAWIEAGEADPELAFWNPEIALRFEQPSFLEQYVFGESATERLISRLTAMEDPASTALNMSYEAGQQGNLILADVLIDVAISGPDLTFEGGKTSWFLEIAELLKDEGFEKYAEKIYQRILQRGPSSGNDSFRIAYMAIAHAGLGSVEKSIHTLATAPDGLPYATGKIYDYAVLEIGYDRAMALNWPMPLGADNLLSGARLLAEAGDMNAASRAFEAGMAMPAGYMGADGTVGMMLARDARAAGDEITASMIIDRLIARNGINGYRLTEMLRNGHALMSPEQIEVILSALSKKRDYSKDYYVAGLAIVGQPVRALAEVNYLAGPDRIIDSLLSVEEALYLAE